MSNDPATESWHVDRRVPLALIVTIGLQTAGVFFWMGQLSVRIEQLETRVLDTTTNTTRLTRLEVQVEQANRILGRIEDIVTK